MLTLVYKKELFLLLMAKTKLARVYVEVLKELKKHLSGTRIPISEYVSEAVQEKMARDRKRKLAKRR